MDTFKLRSWDEYMYLQSDPHQISMGEREVRLDLLLENWLRFHMQGSLWWKSSGREWVLALGTVHEKEGQDGRRAKKRRKF
jgi:hypothetical protein